MSGSDRIWSVNIRKHWVPTSPSEGRTSSRRCQTVTEEVAHGPKRSRGKWMKPSQVKLLAAILIWCGLACYWLTGLLIAILLFNPPQRTDRWLGAVGVWLVATALVVGGNFFRVRAMKQMNATTYPELPPVRPFGGMLVGRVRYLPSWPSA